LQLLSAGPALALTAQALWVDNVTGLYPVQVARVVVPTSAEQVATALHNWPGRVAVGGGRYSMGGQVALNAGLHLDMRAMKKLLWLRPEQRRVRVQAGMRWRDLQDHLDPADLAVKTMQSYSNFTVGGSVSVNAHGRYVGNGPLGFSVLALQLVLADGSVVEASRDQNTALFSAVIGSYGALAVITEVELDLVGNERIEREVRELSLADYPAFFQQQVVGRSDSVMHNADLMPPLFDRPVALTWRRTERALTEPTRLVPRDARYELEKNLIWVMTELPGTSGLRKSVLHPLLDGRPVVKWRNHEASLDVAQLEPRSRAISTYVLQEYFIPQRHFEAFAHGLAQALRRHRVEALNVSIRHSPADTLSLLPWAKEEVFCFVLYFKQRVSPAASVVVGNWTRELIELSLRYQGRYYLPYQLHATREQFNQAYPEVQALRSLKQSVDPEGRFSNELWAKYLGA
jgi:FAD/FMN-containing dehydrogenase